MQTDTLSAIQIYNSLKNRVNYLMLGGGSTFRSTF